LPLSLLSLHPTLFPSNTLPQNQLSLSLSFSPPLSFTRYASRARDIKNTPTTHDDKPSSSSSSSSHSSNNEDKSKLRSAYTEIQKLQFQLQSTKRDFDALKANPNPQSPDAQRKFRTLQRKHDGEIEELQAHMTGIIANKSSALSQTQVMADTVASELDAYKRTSAEQLQEMEQKAAKMVEEAKHSLDDDARRSLKKLAKERKTLKDKNSQLETQVKTMRKELTDISLNNNTSKTNSEFVGDLQTELSTLRSGLERAVHLEDLAAEAKGWKERCVEAIEHLERMKREVGKKRGEKKELETLLKQAAHDKDHLAKQFGALSQTQSASEADLKSHVATAQQELSRVKQKLRDREVQETAAKSRNKDLESRLQQEQNYRQRAETNLVDTKETLQQAEYAWGLEKERLREARTQTVQEKSTVEGRNEYLEREVTRLIAELNEEMKKKEYAERESAKGAPLQARLGKVSEENALLKSDSDSLRNRLRKLEGEARAGAALLVERDGMRDERDKTSAELGSLKAEVHQLRKANDGISASESGTKHELKTEKNLTLDLRLALDKMTRVNSEMQSRVDELSRDLKDSSHDFQRTKKENDKLREDGEAMGALCSSLKKTLDHLEQEKDSDNATIYAKSRAFEDEDSKKSSRIQELENETRKLLDKLGRDEGAASEMEDLMSMHRGRASALTGELSVAQEALSRASVDSKQMNERRLVSEEKLSSEQRAREKLTRENEKLSEKAGSLYNELAALRGARDGDNAAHGASMGAAQAAAERERLTREAAEHRETDLTRRLGEAQAVLTQETGARKGADAAKIAAEVENSNLKAQCDETEQNVRSMKEELYNLYKMVGELKEDNNKARGSSLALTMEIDTVRTRLSETKDRLEGEVVDLKGRCAGVEKERGQYLLENADLRSTVGSKAKKCDQLMSQVQELETENLRSKEDLLEERREVKEKLNEHIRLGIEAVKECREAGYKCGFDDANNELRGTTSMMKKEMDQLMQAMKEREEGTVEMMGQLKENDNDLERELKKLHGKLGERETDVIGLKAKGREKENEMMDLKHQLENEKEDNRGLLNKHRYELTAKDEIIHQHNDEVRSLRKRSQSLEKDIMSVEAQKREYKKELHRAREDGRRTIARAVDLVREKVVNEDGDASMFVDDIFGAEEEDEEDDEEGGRGERGGRGGRGEEEDERSAGSTSTSTTGTPYRGGTAEAGGGGGGGGEGEGSWTPRSQRMSVDVSFFGGPEVGSDDEFSVMSPIGPPQSTETDTPPKAALESLGNLDGDARKKGVRFGANE